MPEDLVWPTVVHGRWPNGKDCVIWVQSAVIKQGLMLSHSVVQGHIVLLHPTTQGMEQKQRVLVALLD
jgi:uncharacterized protein YdhG (YjbR/CyaY superfamily)